MAKRISRRLDPKSVVRKGEIALLSARLRKLKKLDPKSVVRAGELKLKRKKKKIRR